jgi:hypothetical protein
VEVYVSELNMAVNGLHMFAGIVGYVGEVIHECEDTLGRAGSSRELGHDINQHLVVCGMLKQQQQRRRRQQQQ